MGGSHRQAPVGGLAGGLSFGSWLREGSGERGDGRADGGRRASSRGPRGRGTGSGRAHPHLNPASTRAAWQHPGATAGRSVPTSRGVLASCLRFSDGFPLPLGPNQSSCAWTRHLVLPLLGALGSLSRRLAPRLLLEQARPFAPQGLGTCCSDAPGSLREHASLLPAAFPSEPPLQGRVP